MVNIEDIKELLKRKPRLEAESRVLRRCAENVKCSDAMLKEAIERVDEQLFRVDNWLLLLSEDEARAIRRHLIDGVDLPRIALEYRNRWGDGYLKTARTIQRYQSNGLQKIAQFESAMQPFLSE